MFHGWVNMKAEVISKDDIETAVQYIKEGKVIIYPTESSYALGGDAINEEAVKKIRDIKGRYDKAITVIVSDLNTMREFAYIGKRAELLVEEFMPGPLTLVVDKRDVIPSILDPEEIAFRISSNKTAHALTEFFGGLITTTSANISGQMPIYTIGDIFTTFGDSVDLIIDSGNLTKRPVSTILSLRANIPYIKREGAIDRKVLFQMLEKHNIYEYSDYRKDDFEEV